MIRLFIIEDDTTAIVAAFKTFFRPGRDQITVTGCAASMEQALAEADPGTFDLIVLDLWIPGSEPIENVNKLKIRFPEKPIVIYSGEKRPSWKRRMMKAGVMGYVTKDAARDEIRTAILKAAAGEIYITGLKFEYNPDDVAGLFESETHQLTAAELEILEMLQQGIKHSEIAKKMNTSPVNIERTLHFLRRTYKADNNIQLISYLLREGLI